jgi:hypothetical protein
MSDGRGSHEPRVPVLVVGHGAHSRTLIESLARFRPPDGRSGRSLEVSAIQGVSTRRMDPGLLATALRSISRFKPSVVVEAIDDTPLSYELAAHAIRHGASVVTVSACLVGDAGQALHELAAEHGVGFYTEAALGFDLPIGGILRTSLAGDDIRSVNGFLPVAGRSWLAMTYRAAALTSAAYSIPTRVQDVTVEDGDTGPGALPPNWQRRLVVGVTRFAETVHTELFPALLPPTHPIVTARVRSGFVVEAAAAGTLVFTSSETMATAGEWALHSDLAMAIRAAPLVLRGPARPPMSSAVRHGPRRSTGTVPYLVSCAVTRKTDVHAVITALDHPQMTIQELQNTGVSLRMVVHSPSGTAIRSALATPSRTAVMPARVEINRLQITGAGDAADWLRL